MWCKEQRRSKKNEIIENIKTKNNKTFYDKNIDTKTCSSPIMDLYLYKL